MTQPPASGLSAAAAAPAPNTPAGFIQRLESLRGLAALLVAVFHSFMVFRADWLNGFWPEGLSGWQHVQATVLKGILVFCNGPAAVVVFFVLSGYVLARSLEGVRPAVSRWRTLAAFYVRRLLRIYPMHVFWVLLIAGALYVFHTKYDFAHASLMFDGAYRTKIEAGGLLDNLLLLKNDLNPVTWTLRVEVAASLAIPFFYLAYRRRGLLGNLLILTALMALSYAWLPVLRSEAVLGTVPELGRILGHQAVAEPVFFGYMFFLGVMLPRLMNTGMFARGRWSTAAFFAFALLLFSANLLFSQLLPVGDLRNWCFQFCEAAGAAYVVGYICCHQSDRGFLRVLDGWFFHHLGKVSFSFYVTHFAIWYATGWGLCQYLPPAWAGAHPVLIEAGVALFTVPLAFGVSLLTYRFVERPFMAVAKRLSRRILQQNA